MLCYVIQNGHVNSWPTSRQVLMGSWQHLPGLSTQRSMPQTLVPDALAAADSWRQSIMVGDTFDQSPTVFPLVRSLVCGFTSVVRTYILSPAGILSFMVKEH